MKRPRASFKDTCLRWWARLDGRIIRFLQVTRYDDAGNSREYVYRLAASDPRPRGVQMKGHIDSVNRMYAALPLSTWCELVYPC